MSQITRCPSCATSFKVVADQLRISQGWVRCGQCKEVFDASAHLRPPAPPTLLPDLPFNEVKPPPVHVPVPAFASPISVAPSPPAMEVPTAAVPAFLTTGADAGSHGEPSPEPVTPFAWRAPLPSASAMSEALPAQLSHPSPEPNPVPEPSSSTLPTPAVWSRPVRAGPPAVADNEPASLGSLDIASQGRPASDGAYVLVRQAVPGGYELPFAELRDSGWPDDVLPEAATAAELASPAIGVPATPPLHASVSGGPLSEVAPGSATATDLGPPSVEFASPLAEQTGPVLPLVAGDPAAAALHADAGTPFSAQEHIDHEADEEADPGPEVSFVRAARRRALWRRPAVRWVLALLALMALLALAAQVAVHERDRIVAMDVRARPLLTHLCVPLRCEIAPRREIADVVIDSSSFHKARGDSYQLALTLKNQGGSPLATPAIELTLTDAQDQPVLRRVLLPTDMAAPRQLPARGEWSVSVAVIVTTGGARVAGYRLLAFYP